MLPTINTIPSNVLDVINMVKIDNETRKAIMTKYVQDYSYPFCTDTLHYEKLRKIGEGTFGEVFKAKDKRNCQIVAMKKLLIYNEMDGFPANSLREIKILQKLKHENVVNLLEIVGSKSTNNYGISTFYLVFEFCEHDLAGLLANGNVKFNLGEIKKVLQQLWNGLFYIHSNNILHRDIKTSNILITKTGVLKIADFGLARPFNNIQNGISNILTNKVVTMWYRAPELLLGDRNYGPGIDMWSTGCIMAEMWTRIAIMQGTSEYNQIMLISQLCGPITPAVWPGVENLELYKKVKWPQNPKRRVIEKFKPYIEDPYACDLLDKILTVDPSKRINADSALNHNFFWTDPMPCDLKEMMACHTTSMFAYFRPGQRSKIHPLKLYKQYQQQLSKPPTAIEEGYHDRVY